MFNRRLLFFLPIIVLLLLSTACRFSGSDETVGPMPPGDSPQFPESTAVIEYSGRMAPNTFLQTDRVSFLIPENVSVASDSFSIDATIPSDLVKDLKEGTVIIGYENGGFVRRITSITKLDVPGEVDQTNNIEPLKQLRLSTEPAFLYQAFEELRIRFQGKVSDAKAASKRLIQSDDPSERIKASILSSVISSSDIQTLRGSDADTEGEIYGGFSFSPYLDFYYDYSLLRGLRDFRMIFEGSLVGEYGVRASFEKEKEWKRSRKLFSSKIPFIAGTVAGTIDMEMPVGVSVTAKAEGSIDIGKRAIYNVRFGTVYRDGKWDYIRESTLEFEDIFKYELKGEVAVKLSAGLNCTVLLKGLAGPKGELELFLELKGEWEAEDLWKLQATFSYGVTFKPGLVFNLWCWEVTVAPPEAFTVLSGTIWEGRVPFYTTLKGQVIDKYIEDPDFPIADALIEIPDPDDKKTIYKTSTDEEGRFEIDVPLYVVEMDLSAELYEDKNRPIENEDFIPNRVFNWKFTDNIYFDLEQIKLEPLANVKIVIASGSAEPELKLRQTDYTYEFMAIASPAIDLRFEWNYGDGITFTNTAAPAGNATISEVEHTFKDLIGGESFDISVAVFDGDEEIGSDEITVTFDKETASVRIYTNTVLNPQLKSDTKEFTVYLIARADPEGVYTYVWSAEPGHQSVHASVPVGESSEFAYTYSDLDLTPGTTYAFIPSVGLYFADDPSTELAGHGLRFLATVEPEDTPPWGGSFNIRWNRTLKTPEIDF